MNNQFKMFDILGEFEDKYLGSRYILSYMNAKELREYLLDNLQKKNIDINQYNRGGSGAELVVNPPTEIYEYQSFFLLQGNDGDLILLDGFRRLLWYNSPDHTIQVRIYKQSDLSNQQIMKMLIYLNHFKFYAGSGEYYDRGFALAMKIIFGLEIPNYYKTFDAYLTLNETRRSYSNEWVTDSATNANVKNRMLNPYFIDDMKFIEALSKTDTMINDIFGALIYVYRKQYPDKLFDYKFFIEKSSTNKLIIELENKIKTKGDGKSSEAQKNINQLVPLYENILNEMFGTETILTYAEKVDECKKLLETIKKDKRLIKMTGSKSIHWIESAIMLRLRDKKPVKFRCLIYPKEMSGYWLDQNNPDNVLDYGICQYDIAFIGMVKKSLGRNEPCFGLTNEKGFVFEVAHNYQGKKYTHLTSRNGVPRIEYDCELFVEMSKSEYEEIEKNRF